MNQALDHPNVPKIYGNGFVVGTSLTDLTIVTQHNARPTSVVSLSFETAKSLAQNIASAIELLEEAAGATFLTIDDVQKATENISRVDMKP